MTDEAKALVEKLRWSHWYYEDAGENTSYTSEAPLEAADLIETLETQLESANEALRERLDICETQAREIERLQGLVSSCRLQIDQLHDRAALARDSHD